MSGVERKGGRTGRVARGAGTLALLAAALLAACGDAGQLAGGGIGGTGISSGPITAFGSIVVGGVEYELGPDARVYVNGREADQQALALGMMVTVEGRKGSGLNANGYVPGEALRVDYAGDLLGPVEAVDVQAGTLSVLGVTVQVPGTAVLEPAGTTLAGLQPGDWVEVSGLEDPQGVLHATRIERKQQPPAEQELRGLVARLDPNGTFFELRGIQVDASNLRGTVPALRDGLPVRVRGSYAGGLFVASRIEPDEAHVKARAAERLASGDGEAELEGLVSSLTGSVGQTGCRFVLAGVTVGCAGATVEDEYGFGLAEGARVKVEGDLTTDAFGEPLVSARTVSVEGPAAGAPGGAGGGDAQAVFVDWDELRIDDVDRRARTVTVTYQGQRYVVRPDVGTVFKDERDGIDEPLNLGTAFGDGPAALRLGELLEVKGYLQGGTVTAVRLEAKDPAGP